MKNAYFSMLMLVLISVVEVSSQPTATQLTSDDKKILSEVGSRAKRYVDMRNRLRDSLPKLPKDATPEQILANKTAMQSKLQAARINARQGNIFTQSADKLIRSVIKKEFKGYEAKEIREAVWGADPKGILTKVNATYPESKELVEMSPALLIALPPLPKELRYRYIGRNLAILDRDAALILDFMKDALP